MVGHGLLARLASDQGLCLTIVLSLPLIRPRPLLGSTLIYSQKMTFWAKVDRSRLSRTDVVRKHCGNF